MTKGVVSMGFSAEGARETLLAVREARQARWLAEARELRAFAEFADQYRWLPDEGPVLSGMQRLVQWGGDGTPYVAEFCTLEVAAATGMTEEAARSEIATALALRDRLPQVWQAVMAGRLRVWKGRQLAADTHELSADECRQLGDEIQPLLGSMEWTRLRRFVQGRVLEILGRDAQDEHERRMASRRVEIDDAVLGTTDVTAVIGAADGVFLNATLNRLAGILAEGGSQESRDVRRAIALGLLASPARALQLMQASLVDELPEDLDTSCPAFGQRGHTCGEVTVDPETLMPKADLVVHLTDETARAGAGVVRGEKVGPLLTGWLKELLGHTRVSVRPVLDANALVPTDSYECPPRMREAVELRNAHEVFPFAKRRSRGLDMDHTESWTPPRGRRPGSAPPTRPDNLGPLSRKVHRAKTHGDWDVTQPLPGWFLWRSPLGFGYLVTPSQSWMIEDPTGRVLARHEPEVATAS